MAAPDPNARTRPLSPHLDVYKWQVQMVTSILHRATGIALAVGLLGMVWGLLALAGGQDAWAAFAACAGSWFGRLVLFGFSWALAYHLLNGIRHLLWDAGWGFQIPQVYKSGYTVVALTFVFTAAIWFFAMRGAA